MKKDNETKIIDLVQNNKENKQKERLTADGQKILPYITLNIRPVPKPRMTQSDKWKKRPIVEKYRDFKKELQMLCAICQWQPKDDLEVTFVIPMPTTWSERKKKKMDGKPHQKRPDLDNLVKAFKDCLLIEDSHIHTYHSMKKIWGRSGAIIVKR